MHIREQAVNRPDAAAVVMADGGRTSFRALDNGSIALANALHARGLRRGDVVAILLENRPEFFVAAWAAQRLGLYWVPVNWHLKADEVRYILSDSGSQLLISSSMNAAAATIAAQEAGCMLRIDVDDPADWQPVTAAMRTRQEIASDFAPSEGQVMFYSSGTTGRPKGIKRALDDARSFATPGPLDVFLSRFYGLDRDTVYLSPAPLYHAAPLNWSMAILRAGGTVLLMPQFDAARALTLIGEQRVTHAQFVPTMFVRMLRLDEAQRSTVDLSSLKLVAHAGAPCPPEIKRQMLDWWGPIIHEYYGGSEANGITAIGPEDWLRKPGSVGRAVLGTLHIGDDDGEPVSVGTTGTVYFSGMPPFRYHNDDAKTAAAYNRHGWSTLGDIGHLDEDGFLFLTDRKAFMIISGGVNIYPLEIENLLTGHAAVADVAVIGVPHAEFGEEVLAVVQPQPQIFADAALAAELIAYCREHLAHYKCPRRIAFDTALPRMPNGKLLKRLIKDRYAGIGQA